MRKFECPYCGYEFEDDPHEGFVTCPMCNNYFDVDEDNTINNNNDHDPV